MRAEELNRQEALVVTGPALRTSAEHAATDIPAFWQRFMDERWLERLERRADDPAVYSVYCDYESDFRGAYTMVLGIAAQDSAPPPNGARHVVVPAGHYAQFVAKGDPAQTLWRAWAYIGEEWPGRTQRRYAADFERHDLSSLGAADVEVTILVGLA
jgi:predicted transcriptional regulator YdeE